MLSSENPLSSCLRPFEAQALSFFCLRYSYTSEEGLKLKESIKSLRTEHLLISNRPPSLAADELLQALKFPLLLLYKILMLLDLPLLLL